MSTVESPFADGMWDLNSMRLDMRTDEARSIRKRSPILPAFLLATALGISSLACLLSQNANQQIVIPTVTSVSANETGFCPNGTILKNGDSPWTMGKKFGLPGENASEIYIGIDSNPDRVILGRVVVTPLGDRVIEVTEDGEIITDNNSSYTSPVGACAVRLDVQEIEAYLGWDR